MSLARCDVIVVGGGAAGTAAAVGAANAGAQTLSSNPARFWGGASTLKNVLTYCGLFTNHQKKQAVLGLPTRCSNGYVRWVPSRNRSIPRSGRSHRTESVKYVLDQLCKHAGVQVCYTPCFFPHT